jgi:hypothetical protein
MPQSIDRVRSWVEYWSWHVPLGSGQVPEATEVWWSLVVLRHRACVDLTLAVCDPFEGNGSLITNTRRQVAYEGLTGARDYPELVVCLNAELRKLFAEAGAMPPALLPNGRLGVREVDWG